LKRVHAFKKGIRVLGIAESFTPGRDVSSLLAGVVMRRDFIVDGIAFGRATVGGDDATDSIVEMVQSLKRNDVNLVMLSGAVISMYNIVDLDEVCSRTGLPVVCLTYRESSGLVDVIRKHFPKDYRKKVALYRKLGRRVGVTLGTGKTVFVRALGVERGELTELLDSFTLQGKYPEPVRVAGLLAAAARKLSAVGQV